MMIRANGIRYLVKIHRREPALPYLLLLHGFMGSSSVFEHLIQELAGFVNPVTLDLLGHGETEGTFNPERYNLKKQLADLHSIVSDTGLNPFYLHGYSMGGRLALRYALAHPDRLSGLILESTNYGIENSQAREKRIKNDGERAERIKENFSDFLEGWKQLPLFDNGIEVPDHLQQQYQQVQHQQSPGFMAASLKGFGTGTMASVKNELKGLQIPVLLLAGERDDKYVKILSEMDLLMPNSIFHMIEQAGHRVHLENPPAFVERIRKFITG